MFLLSFIIRNDFFFLHLNHNWMWCLLLLHTIIITFPVSYPSSLFTENFILFDSILLTNSSKNMTQSLISIEFAVHFRFAWRVSEQFRMAIFVYPLPDDVGRLNGPSTLVFVFFCCCFSSSLLVRFVFNLIYVNVRR
jgi:hypothetical protein